MGRSSRDRERNILLKAPQSTRREFDCCVDLLTPRPPSELNVWSLGITLPPDERLHIWEARQEVFPADFRIVSAQPLPQDAAMATARDLGVDPAPRFVNFNNPRNLTQLGVELTESLDAWSDTDRKTVACFHSLTPLLEHVSINQAYQFLLPFSAKMREYDVTAHYHLNPRAHDTQDVERLETLFDGIREPTAEVDAER